MGFFDVMVSVLHRLAVSAELERERRQRQPASERLLEGRRAALGISDGDRLLRGYSNLMRDVLATVTVAMLQNDRNKVAFRCVSSCALRERS